MLWHKRLGYESLSLLSKLFSRDLVVGLPSIKHNDDKVCDACARGKQVRTSFKSKNCVSTSQPLELLHVDLCGPMRITSGGGKTYMFVIVDDYCRFTWTLFLASKDESFEKFRVLLKKIEKRLRHSLISLSRTIAKNLKIRVSLIIVMNMVLITTFLPPEHPNRTGW